MVNKINNSMQKPQIGIIQVQLAYARPGLEILMPLQVPIGSTMEQAILQSGIVQQVPEIDTNSCKVGIFGKLKALDTVLRENDRIEIYRPLLADPKIARRQRAEQKRQGKT